MIHTGGWCVCRKVDCDVTLDVKKCSLHSSQIQKAMWQKHIVPPQSSTNSNNWSFLLYSIYAIRKAKWNIPSRPVSNTVHMNLEVLPQQENWLWSADKYSKNLIENFVVQQFNFTDCNKCKKSGFQKKD